MEDSRLLNNVEITCGDFSDMLGYAEDYTFLYPPYRPISNTSSFVSYSKESFNYDSQIRPKEFCDKISNYGYSFMLSNSDNKGANSLGYFDLLYSDYFIERVLASRNINCNPNKRGKITEIVVHNYDLSDIKNTQGLNYLSHNIISFQKQITP